MKNDNLSILIVDDEPEARDLLSMLLQKFEGVHVAGMADDVDQAFQLVLEHLPDLILLDIQMPEKDGFELVQMINERRIQTGYIFITAFDEYAIRAIRASAFDYLLKPVDPESLQASIERYRSEIDKNSLPIKVEQVLANLSGITRIKVNTRTGFIVIDMDELVYCKASGNYTQIHLVSNREEIITINMGNFMEKLKGNGFFRISRSAIINLKYLVQVDNKAGLCKLKGDQPVTLKVTRDKRRDLEKICTGMSNLNSTGLHT